MKLTARQQEVLVAFSFGLTYQETAEALGIKLSTVQTHARRVREELGVKNRAGAISEGFRRGILQREFD